MNKINPNTSCLLIYAGVPSMNTGLATIYYYLKNAKVKIALLNIDSISVASSLHQLEKLNQLRLIGFSMHWHPQIAVSIKLAELIKNLQNLKNTPIVFGGISASYFAVELIKIPCVDYVIKGDGELPMLLLYKYTNKEGIDLSSIPNILYKKNGCYIENKKKYKIDEETITYLEEKVLSSSELFEASSSGLSVGRGCSQNCIYCGGSRTAYVKWAQREEVLKRKVVNLKKSIAKILTKKFNTLYLLHDYDGKCEFLAKCLQEFNLSDIRKLTIDSWGLPDINNISQILKNTPERDGLKVILEISPEVGDESLREKIKGFSFSNKELIDFLASVLARYKKIKIDLFFSYFHPYTSIDNAETRQFIYSLTQKFINYIIKGKLVIYFLPLSTDPGSLIQQNFIKPLKHDLHCFKDYYQKMLSMQVSHGNFLHHCLEKMKIEKIDYYCNFFRFENILLTSYPMFYLSIVKLFTNFKEYSSFLKNCYDLLFELHIKPSLSCGIYGQIINEDSISLLGFHFESDQIPPHERLQIIWLQIIKNALLKNKKNFSKKIFREDCRCHTHVDIGYVPPVNNSDGFIEYKETILACSELYNYTLELLDIILKYKIYMFAKTKPHFHEIVLKNHLKINSIKNNEFENLIPMKSTLCQITDIFFIPIKINTMSTNCSLKMLGMDLLRQILSSIHYDALPENINVALQKYLNCDTNLRNTLLNSFEKIWKVINSLKESQLNDLLAELIITAYIPTKKILRYLNLNINTHCGKNKSMSESDIEILSSLSFNQLFGVFSDILDIRALMFYLNYLKRKYGINQVFKPSGRKITHYLTYIYFDSHSFIKPLVLSGTLNSIEMEAIRLSDGSQTISEIFSNLIGEVEDQYIAARYLKDVMISLYARQLIY